MDDPESIPGSARFFLFSTASRPALGLTQSPIEWAAWTLSSGERIERHVLETNHLLPSSAEVNKGGTVPPLGRATAEAVSRWSLASHREGPGSRPGLASGICGGQNGAGAGFLRVLPFLLPTTFHSTNFSILTITRDRYNRPIYGRSAAWTQYGLHLPQFQ
jgi:hypothetical protein